MNVYSCYLAQILLFLFYDTVDAIDCYVCTSLDKDNKLCMDGFKKNLATSIYISRKCDFDFFKATHCIKLKGVREDGTEILVRQCGDNDWGSHCGDIMYTNGDSGTERINGCLETCDHDGCNTANQMFTFQTCIFTLLPSLMLGIFRL